MIGLSECEQSVYRSKGSAVQKRNGSAVQKRNIYPRYNKGNCMVCNCGIVVCARGILRRAEERGAGDSELLACAAATSSLLWKSLMPVAWKGKINNNH